MTTMKPSSLSSSLLARKGAALPSAPCAFGETPGAPSPTPIRIPPVRIPSVRIPPPATTEERDLRPGGKACSADARTATAPRKSAPQGPRLAVVNTERPKSARRAKISLRLDHERHRRLRLAAAHTERHLQDLIIEALDRHLDELTGCVRAGGCVCYPETSGQDRD